VGAEEVEDGGRTETLRGEREEDRSTLLTALVGDVVDVTDGPPTITTPFTKSGM